MSKDFKQVVIDKLNTRIDLLKEHRHDEIVDTDNQYNELNQAVSKVINVALSKELEGLKTYIENL